MTLLIAQIRSPRISWTPRIGWDELIMGHEICPGVEAIYQVF